MNKQMQAQLNAVRNQMPKNLRGGITRMTYIAVKVSEDTMAGLKEGLTAPHTSFYPIIVGTVITSNGEVPVVGTEIELVFATQS